ncbi:MAG: nicotinate (nicotinamide) nucleotide adenylyltransferase [Clostridia bacterium]|nr:nicotinate (nicotinamide) nucleotide adenylyltransferase [Clostridia bacterium]
MKRIGIYGGTFAPVHMGHIRAAEAFLEFWQPELLYVIPTCLPPHKQAVKGDDPFHRLAMTREAFASVSDRIVVSDYEIRGGSCSYTALTMAHFSGADVKLCFLCGTDMFLTLDTWFRAEDIFTLAEIALIRRENADDEAILIKKAEYEQVYGAKIHLIDAPVYEISSTELRRKIADGEDTESLILPEIADYIRRNRLYTE